MSFPPETLAKAREIADLYRKRKSTNLGRAQSLYDSNFLHIYYGFDDAIKSGRCGHFLHQVENDAECFSLTGINYIIAKELGLKPKMYWAADARDIKEGKSEEKGGGDHSFISVQLKGREYILDPHYSNFGRMTIKTDRILISQSNKDDLGRDEIERVFKSLVEITEEEYVQMMHEHQSPEGGKDVLAAGQKVRSKGGWNVWLQYLSDSRELIASMRIDNGKSIYDEGPDRSHVVDLRAPIAEDGTWSPEEGVIDYYFVKGVGWLREQHILPSMKTSLPVKVVAQYVEHLAVAARHFGRKTDIADLSCPDTEDYFFDRGFSLLGDVTKENGVDPKAHQVLLEQIVDAIDIHDEPEEAVPWIHQDAVYFEQIMEARGETNDGWVYSEAERDKMVKELSVLFEEGAVSRHRLWLDQIFARGGLKDNLKQRRKAVRVSCNDIGRDVRFASIMVDRRKFRHSFDGAIDFACFQRDNPVGKITASDDALLKLHLNRNHKRMMYFTFALPALQLKKYRHGLKRILRN